MKISSRLGNLKSKITSRISRLGVIPEPPLHKLYQEKEDGSVHLLMDMWGAESPKLVCLHTGTKNLKKKRHVGQVTTFMGSRPDPQLFDPFYGELVITQELSE